MEMYKLDEYKDEALQKKTGHSGATLPAFWSKTPI